MDGYYAQNGASYSYEWPSAGMGSTQFASNKVFIKVSNIGIIF
jgi:hypothetical protein